MNLGEASQWISAVSALLATLFALCALVVSIAAYYLQHKASRVEDVKLEELAESNRRAQASHLSAWAATNTTNSRVVSDLHVSLFNSSDSPVYNVNVRVVDDSDTAFENLDLPVLPPTALNRGGHQINIESPESQKVRRARVAMNFTDCYGQRWTRTKYGRLETVPSRLVVRTDDVASSWLTELVSDFRNDFGVDLVVKDDIGGDELRRAFAHQNQLDSPFVADMILGPHDWIGELLVNNSIKTFQLPREASVSSAGISHVPYPECAWPAGVNPIARRAWDVFTRESGAVGVPVTVETPLLLFNKRLVPEAPRTVEEMLRSGLNLVSQAAAELPFTVSHSALGDPFMIWPLFAAAGGRIFAPGERGWLPSLDALRSPETVAALGRLQSLAQVCPNTFDVAVDFVTSRNLFLAERAPYTINFGGIVSRAEREGISVGYCPFPPFADLAPAPGICLVLGFIISRQSENHELAEDLIVPYMRRRRVTNQLARTKNSPVISGREIQAGTPVAMSMLEALTHTLPMPDSPEMDCIWKLLGRMFSRVCRGDDPTTTAIAAHEEWRHLHNC